MIIQPISIKISKIIILISTLIIIENRKNSFYEYDFAGNNGSLGAKNDKYKSFSNSNQRNSFDTTSLRKTSRSRSRNQNDQSDDRYIFTKANKYLKKLDE